eukprot:maker-scaffold564_size136232-snap-gene-0.31 protein:Tk11644 transcript:maker-scaffold564_size136232-snap-gene-0.31-mRNA-1 annotation:"synaptic vesicle 2-related protein"
MPSTDLDVYTVGQAIDNLGFGRFQIYLSIMVGFANIADAMEMMILSVLAPALHCHWHITQYQQALLTTVVFLGMMISSPIWGKVADSFGRRPTLIWTSFFLFYFGLLTSMSPSFEWVLFLRFLVGVFIGGVPQACTLYAEYLPSSARGKAIMVLSFFWALGACLLAFMAWLIMPTLGWRYLVAFSTLPLFLFLIFARHLPESPMYLAVTGQKQAVQEVLDRIAKMNEKRRVHGQLILDEETTASQRGQFLDLFRKGQAQMSVMVFFLWFVAAFSYYGVVLLSTELLNSSRDTCASSGESPIDGIPGERECSVHVCQGLKDKDYVELIKTSFAEFPGTFVALLLIDRIGRRKTLATLAVLFAICSLLVMECTWGKSFLVVVLFGARGFAAGFFQSVYVYTPEVYPTRLRALALGIGSGFARVGAMITPFVAQVLLRTSLYSAMSVYAGLGVLAMVVALFLPVETCGQDLTQAVITPKTAAKAKSKEKMNKLVDEMENNEAEQASEDRF